MTNTDAPGPLVEVEWMDSAGRGEWHDAEDAVKMLDQIACRSAGYLLADDDRGVVVALGFGDMGSVLDSMAIPRVAVVRVRRLTTTDEGAGE